MKVTVLFFSHGVLLAVGQQPDNCAEVSQYFGHEFDFLNVKKKEGNGPVHELRVFSSEEQVG